MKQILHKSMSIFMAIVVMVTTMSFTIDMHYCGDTMVDFSFVQQVKTCGMEKAQVAPTCKDSELKKKSCCSDQQLSIEGQDDLKVSYDQLTFGQNIFIASFTYAYISLFEGTTSNKIPSFDYVPPFVKQDVQVLHQTFLI